MLAPTLVVCYLLLAVSPNSVSHTDKKNFLEEDTFRQQDCRAWTVNLKANIEGYYNKNCNMQYGNILCDEVGWGVAVL